jgi:hypothetical protein
VQASNIITSARNKYGVPAGSNRYTDTVMLQLLQDATSAIATETDFPEGTYPITTTAGVREYQMIDCVKILRCYLIQNGVFQTPLPGYDIPTLEGDVLMIYDQSSGQITGNEQFSPQYLAEQPQAYPLSNAPQQQQPVPTALPYFSVTASTQRGVYYKRGGYIGVVPPPATSGLILAVDIVPLQPIISNDSTLLIYPQVYTDALAYKMCAYMAESDRSAMAQVYNAHYEKLTPELRTWVDNLWATKPKRFTPITKRTFTHYGDGFDWGGW